jgi:hypothetical protein
VTSDDGELGLKALRRRFGETIALDGLTFTVPRGQVFGFLGPTARRQDDRDARHRRRRGTGQRQPALERRGYRRGENGFTVASTVWMARLAGTIYGRAILRTGSRLKVRQVLRSAA